MSFLAMLTGVGIAIAAALTFALKYLAQTYKIGPFMVSTDNDPLVVIPVLPIEKSPNLPQDETSQAPIATTLTRVERCAMAQKAFEGWYLPGSTHSGVLYPKGSPSFQRNNPGNCKSVNGKFLTFPTTEAGLKYLEDYIIRVATGKHKAYPKGGKTTFYEYTHIYTSDKEPAPTNYANALCTAVGATPETTLDYLLI